MAMRTQGYGYRAWGASGKPMDPTQVGESLQQQGPSGMPGMSGGGMPSLGLPGMDPMAGGMPPDPMQGDPMMGGMPGMAPPPLTPDGQSGYDPGEEHSASSTKAALEDAIRRMQDAGRPQREKPLAPSAKWQLASLGLPPVEIELLIASGDGAGAIE